MNNILLEIINKTKQDLLVRKKINPLNDNKFYQIFSKPKPGVGIIAEVKFASPTNLKLGSPSNLVNLVKSYEQAGADAISVITEKHFFNGRLKFVSQIKKTTSLPILQKDFVVDEYQIFESKNLGTDAILLIAKILNQRILNKFVKLALDLGIEPVVEINNEEDLEKACGTKTHIIAANARNLNTLEIDIDNACKLINKIPKKYIRVGFSGIKGKKEMEKYKNAGASGVLIGTSLMKSDNISQFIKDIRT